MPAAAVLFAFAMESLAGNILPRVQWRPREVNRWADDLAGGRLNDFDRSREIIIEASLPEVDWFVCAHADAERTYAEAQVAAQSARALSGRARRL